MLELAVSSPERPTGNRLAQVLELLVDGGAPLSHERESKHLISLLLSRGDWRVEESADNVSALAVLLARGSDPNAFIPDVDYATPKGPLYAAVSNARDQSAQLLLKAGADPEGQDGRLLGRIRYLRNERASPAASRILISLLEAGANPMSPVFTLGDQTTYIQLIHPIINDAFGAIGILEGYGADLDVRVGQQATYGRSRTPRQMINHRLRRGDEAGFDGFRPSQVSEVAQQIKLERATPMPSPSARRAPRL